MLRYMLEGFSLELHRPQAPGCAEGHVELSQLHRSGKHTERTMRLLKSYASITNLLSQFALVFCLEYCSWGFLSGFVKFEKDAGELKVSRSYMLFIKRGHDSCKVVRANICILYRAAKTSSEQEFVVCFLDDGAIVIQKAASRYVVRLTHKYRAREIGRYIIFF